MGLNNLGMGIVFTASDLASNVVRQVSTVVTGLDGTVGRASSSMAEKLGISTEVMSASLKFLVGGLIAATIGVSGLVAAFELAEPAGKFEQGLAAIGAVTRATTQEIRSLRDAAIEAGIATQFSPTQAIEGLTSLATAGQTATQATQTLVPVLDLAAGSLGQLGVAGAAEAVVGTLNSYQKSAGEAASVTDRLLRITQLSNFQTRDFSSGLSKAAAAGATFNQSLDDVLISMGLMRNANLDASSSATAFREATRRLGADQRAQRAVTELGITVFDKQSGQMRSLLDIMGEFSKATANLTDKEKLRRVQAAFGARGLLAFNAISKATFQTVEDGVAVTLKGADAIAAMRKEMGNAEGTAKAFREALLDTFEGQKTLLKGTMDTIAIVIGEPFAKILKPVVGAVVDGLNFVLKLLNDMPDAVKKGFAGGFIISSLGLVIGGVVAAVGALATAFGGAILSALATAAPIIAIVVAGLALMTAEVLVLKTAWDNNFGGIRDTVLPIIGKISLAVRSLFELLTTGRISGALAEDLVKAENQGVFRFVNTLSRVFTVVMAVFTGVSRAFGRIFTKLSTAATPIFAKLGSIASRLGDTFSRLFAIASRVFGFEQAEDGIFLIEMLADVFISNFLEPAVFGIEILAKGVENFLTLLDAVLMAVNLIIDGFTKLGDVVNNDSKFGSFLKIVNPTLALAGASASDTTSGTGSRSGAVSVPASGGTVGEIPESSGSGNGFSLAGLTAAVSKALENNASTDTRENAVTVAGSVFLDGVEVGEVRDQNDRDRRAGVGRLRSPIGGD